MTDLHDPQISELQHARPAPTTDFWKGPFGDAYNDRNVNLQASYTAMWAKILARTTGIASVMELGCGTGQNLDAIRHLDPAIETYGIEANAQAAAAAQERHEVIQADILTARRPQFFDLTFTRGVLIHLEAASLLQAYQHLVEASAKYVMVCEYYNPTRVEIPYRGHAGKLWKADFAGEIMDRHGLHLVDYGFVYRRGPFPQDNVTWFLMEKR